MTTQTNTEQKIKFWNEILKEYKNNLDKRIKDAKLKVLKENKDIVNKIEDLKKRIEVLKE